MPKAFIDPDKCIRCKACSAEKAYTLRAIFHISPDEPAVIDMTFCRGCGDCLEKCKPCAVTLRV